MNIKYFFLSTALLLAVTVNVFAESHIDIIQRMDQRLDAIIKMKMTLLIGENNQAYLTVLKPVSEQQAAMVKNENEDRLKIYKILSQKENLPFEVVLERRTVKLHEQVAPGMMIQTESGEWVAKSEPAEITD